MSSMDPVNFGIFSKNESKSNIPQLKNIKIGESNDMAKFKGIGTSKKNADGLIGGMRKYDVDNQMTQRGKLANQNPYTGSNIQIEKFTQRLAQNGQVKIQASQTADMNIDPN